MFVQTPAIVLHQTPYNDRYGIVHCYTVHMGRVNFLVSKPSSGGGKKRGGRSTWQTLQPLVEVELNYEIRPHRDLHHIQEFKVTAARIPLYSHPVKSSVALFLSELLYRLLSHSESDPVLYDYIVHSLALLDGEVSAKAIANFHLCFMLHLTAYLGIAPDLTLSERPRYFDLREGHYIGHAPMHQDYLTGQELTYLSSFARITFANSRRYQYNRAQRARILELLIHYYRIHLPPFGALRSPEILRTLYGG